MSGHRSTRRPKRHRYRFHYLLHFVVDGYLMPSFVLVSFAYLAGNGWVYIQQSWVHFGRVPFPNEHNIESSSQSLNEDHVGFDRRWMKAMPRWAPFPQKSFPSPSGVLDSGFPHILFLESDRTRLLPRQKAPTLLPSSNHSPKTWRSLEFLRRVGTSLGVAFLSRCTAIGKGFSSSCGPP